MVGPQTAFSWQLAAHWSTPIYLFVFSLYRQPQNVFQAKSRQRPCSHIKTGIFAVKHITTWKDSRMPVASLPVPAKCQKLKFHGEWLVLLCVHKSLHDVMCTTDLWMLANTNHSVRKLQLLTRCWNRQRDNLKWQWAAKSGSETTFKLVHRQNRNLKPNRMTEKDYVEISASFRRNLKTETYLQEQT